MPASSFVWYELMTPDPRAAASFYGAVAGWGARKAGGAGLPYTVFTAGDGRVAGMLELTPEMREGGARPGWIGYVGVDDADAMVARIEGAGGAVHRPPADIPEVGRFAVVSDPQGAAFVVVRPDTAPDVVSPGAPGTFGWRELHAGEWTAAFAFYADLFGWTKGDAVDMGPMGTYQLFTPGGGEAIGGMMTRTPDVPRPFWLYYVNVADIAAAAARVGEGGGAVLNGPHPVPGGMMIVQCRDPQGAMFALVGPGAR